MELSDVEKLRAVAARCEHLSGATLEYEASEKLLAFAHILGAIADQLETLVGSSEH